MNFAAFTREMPKLVGFKPANETEDFLFNAIKGREHRLRSSKPTIKKDDPRTGEASYVWRMVAFQVSPKPAHQCMPCTAEFDMAYDFSDPQRYEKRKARCKELDALVERIVMSCVPLRQQHGVIRWGRALGHIS
jgi:hypothetical protein